jgi:phage shock protein A
MAAQSILGRITQMARANIHEMLDRAEDPQVMLDQLVRDYTANIKEAEELVAQNIGNLRQVEADRKQAQVAIKEWGAKARAAKAKADELKAQSSPEAEKFYDLARVAISRQLAAENEIASYEPLIKEQTDVTDRLKEGLSEMRSKLEVLRNKRNELASRAKVAKTREKMQDMRGSIDAMDPTSDLGRYEEMVQQMEARVQGKEELAAESMDAQFESLTKYARDEEVEKRLTAL